MFPLVLRPADVLGAVTSLSEELLKCCNPFVEVLWYEKVSIGPREWESGEGEVMESVDSCGRGRRWEQRERSVGKERRSEEREESGERKEGVGGEERNGKKDFRSIKACSSDLPVSSPMDVVTT